MRFESFLARRYLFTRGKETLIWIITGVSVAGVAIGVAALITVISVMDGFNKELVARILGVTSHARLSAAAPGGLIEDYKPLVEALENRPGVIAAAPLISESVILQADLGTEESKIGALLYGIEPDLDKNVTQISSSVMEGGNNHPGHREVVLGYILAYQLGVQIGDEIQCFTTRVRQTAMGYNLRRVPLKVVGLFKCGMYELDQSVCYVGIDEAEKILADGDPGWCREIQVRVEDPRHMDNFGEMIGSPHPFFPKVVQVGGVDVYYRTWQELNPTFFMALELEKYAMFVILLMIVVVAAFNIIGTMVMSVTQKTREIGLLQAVGASPRMIRGIFIRMGIILGALGTGVGTALGLTICIWIKYITPFPLPEEVYNLDHLPVEISALTIGVIVFSAMAICLIASVVPAARAAALRPTEALRYE